MRTPGTWRAEAVSDAVRVVVGGGRSKIILARLAPKQIPEAETHDNAELMAMAPLLAEALVFMVESGVLSGYDHPVHLCICEGCVIRRRAAKAKKLLGKA